MRSGPYTWFVRAVLLAAVFVLATASVATATIVLQRGMADVRLGMTQARVRAVLGEPLRTEHGSNDFGSYTELRFPHRIRVVFQGDLRVTSISTTGRHERTTGGIGVGSTEAEVKANVPSVSCETFVGLRSCYVGTFAPGSRVTDFQLRNGRVTRVTVGFVID
jgi:hypothetical protein